jgi:hypothetical protein
MAPIREARLKPEFAHLYPGIEPGVWEAAATVAEHLAMRRRRGSHPVPEGDRILPSEHFEFRGGTEEVFRWSARSRASDA